MTKVTPMVGDRVYAIVTSPDGAEVWRKQLAIRYKADSDVQVPTPPVAHTRDGNVYSLELHQPTGDKHVLKVWFLKDEK